MKKKVLLSTALKNKFKNIEIPLEFHIKNILINGEKRGCSGFIKNTENNNIVYLTTEPLTFGPLSGKIMYRTAKSLKDYTGGNNHWTTEENFVDSVKAMLISGR